MRVLRIRLDVHNVAISATRGSALDAARQDKLAFHSVPGGALNHRRDANERR
jgi:hypothetical protein